ncbi:HAMP domain-containing histidine kinase [Pontibacter sp. Tf4]|uniref:sensor histidine kinase n=1 Tax=Pontibacter sp. Tf4 TaxID=2761620 RepID=UPI001628929D|nr:HAMP domain-containing sensor histidine kinase [Pontibacter sp. Tf4]MBB6611653.1 HAMP domain-containing histidine kinase [Pontibacter sp. Tf4]
MIFKTFEARLTFRVLLLLVSLSLPAIVVVNGMAEVLVFLVPVVIYQVYELIQFVKKAQQEFDQFVESVHYRDFSRHFNEQQAPVELEVLRKGFNEINSTFKALTQEKESQFQNLQQVIALVNTGILTYELETGQVVLLNESLKKLLHLPHLSTVHALANRDEALYQEVLKLQPGHTRITTAHTTYLEKTSFKVLLSATAFQNAGRMYKLVAFQNVNEALDETESQAWQKLLNVMTHEIMNSVAPISSLADTLKNRLHQTTIDELTQDDVDDLEVGVETIKRRSQGLLRFAETYRNLSKITTLNQETVYVQDLFHNLQRLMQPTFDQKNIQLRIQLKNPQISLKADPNLLEQVLINLLVNAIEAVKENPAAEIVLSAFTDAEDKTVIKVSDNGTGMSREVQEKIFIPFFSTKKNGTGIGLSLCKQIILLHRGSIQVQSEEGAGTSFALRFS